MGYEGKAVINEKNKKPTYSTFLESFLDVKDEELKLKFIFDNLRNYGIAGGVFYAGVHLFNNGSLILNFIPYSGIVIGILLAVLGFLLMCLNIIQGILATIKQDTKMVPYVVFNLLVVFSVIDFFWFWVSKHQC